MLFNTVVLGVVVHFKYQLLRLLTIVLPIGWHVFILNLILLVRLLTLNFASTTLNKCEVTISPNFTHYFLCHLLGEVSIYTKKQLYSGVLKPLKRDFLLYLQLFLPEFLVMRLN